MKEKLIIENNIEGWLNDHGFKYQITKQLQSRTEWKIAKGGVEDILSIPLELKDVETYMTQYEKQFEILKELIELKKRLN